MLKLYFHFLSGMPYSFRQAGLGLGIIILTLVAIISGKFLQFCNLFSEMHDSKIPETSTVVVIECNWCTRELIHGEIVIATSLRFKILSGADDMILVSWLINDAKRVIDPIAPYRWVHIYYQRWHTKSKKLDSRTIKSFKK